MHQLSPVSVGRCSGSSTRASAVRADDERLVTWAQAGDEAALTELMTRYQPLVHGRAQSYYLIGADSDDLAQEGMVGLYQAIRDFDGRAEGFAGFAKVCVHRQVLSAIRAASRHKHGPLNCYVSFSIPEDPDAEHPDELDASTASYGDPADVVIARERARALQRHVQATLSQLEAQVLQLRVEGRGQIETANRLNRRTKTVDNALQRVRRKVAEHLQAWDLAATG